MVETALYTYLAGKTSITSIVGTNIWKGRLPQSYSWVAPALSFRRISELHDHDLDGGSGIARARMQIDCWSKTASAAESLAEQVRTLLQGYSGTIGSVTATSVVLDNVVSLPEPPIDSSDDWRFHIALDFIVIYRESSPQF